MAYKLKTVLDDELDRNIKAQEEQEQQQAQEKPTVNTTQNTARTTTVSSTVPATQTNNAAPVKSAAVDQAYALLQQQQTNNLSKWQDAADAYLSRYENRDPFVYNMNADALYNQYKDMYVNQGQLASMDVMGQAAALTGGYGNSYAQSVGHQAYNQYLGQLNTIVPELYQQAYDRYAQEGQNLLNMYDIYTNRENQEYARDWEKQMFEYQKERDKVADEQWEKTYNKSVRTYTGGNPDDDDPDDDDDNYDNGKVSTANIKAMQAALGVDADGMWGEKSQKAAGGLSADEAYKQFTMGKLSGAQRVSDGMIKKFQSTIQPEKLHDAVARDMYGPYTSYVAYMLEKDTTLTDAEKDYLISYYGITSSDRQYLIDKGLIK